MSAERTDTSLSRRYVTLAIKIAVSVVLLAVLFTRVDAGRLWTIARHASPAWLAAALLLYFATVLASVWRWRLLLNAQGVTIRIRALLASYLVAAFFNNFLPSNIGGDVIRIRDSARLAGSKTLATIVVLTDRVLGLMALVFVAALSASATAGAAARGAAPLWAPWLWAGFLLAAAAAAPAVLAPAGFSRLLQPLTVFHPEWVGDRIEKLTDVLSRFRERPTAIVTCFGAAIVVQGSMIVFYLMVVYALRLNVTFWNLAVIVPLSFVVQVLPVSVNGFGVREATFSLYFARLGLPIESAVIMSLVGAVLLMVFSLSGAAVWFARGHH
jgi:uncharacterized membrane protein YbhN (UPF0104 family)